MTGDQASLTAVRDPIRRYRDLLTNSAMWAEYRPRSGDVIVTTPVKSGTTWTQGILALLISGDPEVRADPSINAPWFDNGMSDATEKAARLDAQAHLRQVKSHTPLDGIPLWDDVRYITIYRHPVDVHFSSRKHLANYRPEIAEMIGVDQQRHADDPKAAFHAFLESDDMDHGSLSGVVGHYVSTRCHEPRENILRLHYADMTRDLGGCMERIAAHIGVHHPPEHLDRLVQAASFANMKANADRFALATDMPFWKSNAGFFDSGTSNKWEGILDEADLAAYDARLDGLLTPAERHWLEWGSV